METRIDFLQCLQSDISLYILKRLDDPSDLIRASSVSHFWRHFVIANGLCAQLCERIFPQLTHVSHVIEPECTSKKSAGTGSSNSAEWETLEWDHRVYLSLFRAITVFKPCDCLAGAISASSTDNYPEESIVNTLLPEDVILERASYWSSTGQSDPQVPETLIYKLRSDFCAITEVSIKPFQAYFQDGHPIYSAKSVRFRTGYLKSPSDMEKDFRHLPLERHADDKFIWTFTSKEFPMDHDNKLQEFKLPEPFICIGGYLQIELLGRVQKQDMDGLLYICVSHVQVIGRSLTPAFEVELLQPPSSGKFSLKYCAEKFEAGLSGEVPPLPNRLWGFVGLGYFMHVNEQIFDPDEQFFPNFDPDADDHFE